jgi:predicted MPP superfamily phosphohydrolase
MDGQAILYDSAIVAAVAAPLGLAGAYLRFRAARQRRRILKAAAALALPYLCFCYAVFIEPKTLVVRRLTVVDANWVGPPLKIGVIADTHVGGPHVSPGRVARIVGRMNALEPDMVALLGDYVNDHDPAYLRSARANAEVREGIAVFAGLSAPRGVYAVLGNHDLYYGGDLVRAALKDARVRVLENQAAAIPGTNAYAAGLAEYATLDADAAAALRGVPAQSNAIVLMHWPDSFPTVPRRVTLSLSGHSHCGQVGLPFASAIMSASPGARRYRCGLYQEKDGRRIYVSGGVGTSILPLRFLAPPDIAVLTVRGP